MEKDAGDSLKYYLKVPMEHQSDLSRIRHWSNLKAAIDKDIIWIKDLDYNQVHSIEVRSIPFRTAYYEKGNRLFLLDRNLPELIVPSMLWTPIDRAFPARIPALNHNLFGTQERIQVTFATRNVESETVAMVTTRQVLEGYMYTAPAIRLEKIRWALLQDGRVFLLGMPPLPVPGDTYWSRKDQLLPTGFDFELHILSDLIQKKVNPGRDNWVLWKSEGPSYQLIPKAGVVPLSRSSFRLSLNRLLKSDV